MTGSKTVKRIAVVGMVVALAVVSIGGVSGADVLLQEESALDPITGIDTDPITDPITDPVTEVIDGVGATVEDALNPSPNPPPPGEDPGPSPEESGGQETESGASGETNSGATTSPSTTGTTGPSSTIETPTAHASQSGLVSQEAASTEDFSDFLAAIQRYERRYEGVERQHFGDYPAPRRGPRSTVRIIETLKAKGASPSAIARILAPFPVADKAFYGDDWGQPRFDPYFHSHEGTDIFAEQGAPVISCAQGVVTNMALVSAVGGTSLRVTAADGTYCYYAHLDSFALGIYEGKRVALGETVGSVGTSGNAEGGRPHLHFEIHPKGGAAVPPVPYLDRWLIEAMAGAEAFVAAPQSNTDLLGAFRDRVSAVAGTLKGVELPQAETAAASSPTLPPLLVPVVAAALLIVWRRRRRIVAPATEEASDGWWVELP